MDNTREKLIELIGSTEYGSGSLIGKNFQEGFIAKIADHLIANGVTVTDTNVGKWIPVTERKPTKEDAKVLDGYIIAIMKGRKPNIWKWSEVASYPHYFTHWMPLPEPPKGE